MSELDDLVAALRSPAEPDELVGSDAALHSMTAAFQQSRRGTSMFTSIRRNRVAVMIAAGVIGFGGVAAAGPGGFDIGGDEAPVTTDSVPEDSVPDSVPVDTVVDSVPVDTAPVDSIPDSTPVDDITTDDSVPNSTVDDTDTDTDTGDLVDDPDTAFDETQCAEGNHGKTVSSVAEETESGPGKGAVVSEAAHSSCGKGDDDDRDAVDSSQSDDHDDDDDHEVDDNYDHDDHDDNDDRDDHDDESDDDHESDDGADRGGDDGHADSSTGEDKGRSGDDTGRGGTGNGSSGNGKGKSKGDK